jgi:ribonuclease Z
VDCGEGTQRQFRKAKINPGKVTRLLITHWHGDHVLGIPGLIQTLALSKYNKTLYIYGPKGTKKFINEIIGIFVQVLKIKIEVKEVDGKFFENDDFSLTAEKLDHGIPSNGYAFVEKDKNRLDKAKLKKALKGLKMGKKDEVKLGKLRSGKDVVIDGKKIKSKGLVYSQKGKKISFIFDTGKCSGASKLAKDSDLAVMESTYSNDEVELAGKYHHLTTSMAAEIAKKAGVKELVLTHISQRFEYKEKKLLKEAREVFKNTRIARDLMTVEV